MVYRFGAWFNKLLLDQSNYVVSQDSFSTLRPIYQFDTDSFILFAFMTTNSALSAD